MNFTHHLGDKTDHEGNHCFSTKIKYKIKNKSQEIRIRVMLLKLGTSYEPQERLKMMPTVLLLWQQFGF